MNQTFFYRFDTEQEALDAFYSITVNGAFELEVIAVDVIGTIYKETGVMIPDPPFGEYPELVALPWFHLNTTERLDGFAQWEVFPVTPYRVFM